MEEEGTWTKVPSRVASQREVRFAITQSHVGSQVSGSASVGSGPAEGVPSRGVAGACFGDSITSSRDSTAHGSLSQLPTLSVCAHKCTVDFSPKTECLGIGAERIIACQQQPRLDLLVDLQAFGSQEVEANTSQVDSDGCKEQDTRLDLRMLSRQGSRATCLCVLPALDGSPERALQRRDLCCTAAAASDKVEAFSAEDFGSSLQKFHHCSRSVLLLQRHHPALDRSVCCLRKCREKRWDDHAVAKELHHLMTT